MACTWIVQDSYNKECQCTSYIYYWRKNTVLVKSLVESSTFAIPKSPRRTRPCYKNIFWVFKSLCRFFNHEDNIMQEKFKQINPEFNFLKSFFLFKFSFYYTYHPHHSISL